MRKNHLLSGLITASVGIIMLFLFALPTIAQTDHADGSASDPSRLEQILVNQLSGTLNPADVVKAHEQADALRNKAAAGSMNLNWIGIGPDNYPGLVWSVIYDKNDAASNTLIAGTENGGIWKSTNLGLTWSPMTAENNKVLRVSSLVQSSNGDVYAATGVVNCRVSVVGDGIYKSEGGGTFTAIPATQSNTDFTQVTKLAIDPGTGRIYAATKGGLYYSDNGIAWNLAKQGFARNVSVGADGTVLAAIGDSGYMAVGGNVSSWVTLTTGKTNMLPKSGFGWLVFAQAPTDANIMYASMSGIDGRLVNVYTSTDKGTTWSVIFPGNPAYEPFGANGCYSHTLIVFPDDPNKVFLGGVNLWYGKRTPSAGYFSWEMLSEGIYSPWVPNSAPMYHHQYMFNPGNSRQFVVASDGGVSLGNITSTGIDFQTSNKNFASSQLYALSFSSEKNLVMTGGKNVGTLAMGYYFPSVVNSPTDGFPTYQPLGLLTGTNAGPCVWSNLNSNYAVFTVRGTSVLYRRDLRDLTYENDFMSGIGSAYTDYGPMHLWESFTFSQTKDSVKVKARAIPFPADTVIQVESANGITFPYRVTKPMAIGDSVIIADPVASRFFYYGNKATTNYGYGIYMTKDMLKFAKDPEYFIILKDTANKVDLISTFTVSPDLNTLWAGTKAGRLIRLTGLVNANDSATANAYRPECVITKDVFILPQFTGRNVTSISINPSNSNHVLVTLGNYGNQDYVYYSTDAGSANPTFTSVQSNLPKAPVFSGLIELSGNRAIVGTDVGLFSTDGLNSGNPQWGANQDNIGNVQVTDIRQQTMRDYHIRNYGVIYLATFGRGLWMDTTYYTPVGIDPIVYNKTQNPITLHPNPATDVLTVNFFNAVAGNVDVALYDLTGKMVMSHSFGYQPKGDFRGTINASALPSGMYIVKSGSAVGKLIRK